MKSTIQLLVIIALVTTFSRFSTLYAQENKVQSVIICLTVHGVYYNKYTVEVVKPDYSIEMKEYSTKDNVHVTLKQELDKWLEQGYKIKESNSSYISGGYPISRYILVKE